jgi:PufQ cytochrome subunit
MSDFTASGDLHQVKRVSRTEFGIYFTLIFALALPLHLVGWTYQALRHLRLPNRNPLMRAGLDARAITPMIFRG